MKIIVNYHKSGLIT